MNLKFEPIRLEKQQAYLKLLEKCAQKSSDYSFSNLFGWGEEYGLSWAWQDGLVWIKQTRPDVCCWAPIGRSPPSRMKSDRAPNRRGSCQKG